MTAAHGVVLLAVGAIAGALNAVAGGGSFLSFPTLIFLGMPPVQANATNTVALWFGLAVSGGTYRRHLDTPRNLLYPLVATSIAGGIAGAVLLLKTPQHTFLHLIPWLLLLASLLFLFGDKLRRGPVQGAPDLAPTTWRAIAAASLFEFLVAVYGGYFGAGIGFMQLAMMAVLGLKDIHAMNALRLVMVTAINLMAVLVFIVAGAVYWPQELVMMLGAMAGGWLGARVMQQVAPRKLRYAIIAVGLSMTAYFFVKAYVLG